MLSLALRSRLLFFLFTRAAVKKDLQNALRRNLIDKLFTVFTADASGDEFSRCSSGAKAFVLHHNFYRNRLLKQLGEPEHFFGLRPRLAFLIQWNADH